MLSRPEMARFRGLERYSRTAVGTQYRILARVPFGGYSCKPSYYYSLLTHFYCKIALGCPNFANFDLLTRARARSGHNMYHVTPPFARAPGGAMRARAANAFSLSWP